MSFCYFETALVRTKGVEPAVRKILSFNLSFEQMVTGYVFVVLNASKGSHKLAAKSLLLELIFEDGQTRRDHEVLCGASIVFFRKPH